jgi:hypothetical protein
MKKISLVLAVFISFLSVAQESNSPYPKGVQNMFDAHGSYESWSAMKNLSFDLLKKEKPTETHTVNLKSRKTLIESSGFTIGFDGKQVWVNKDGKFPIERARFYHNLYFYFYAMPFVLGDPGIQYSKAKDLNFEGKSYTGFKISYGDNVGDSPDDNYFVYLDKKSNRMVWLGYTVTYGDDKPSTEIHYIKYTDWITVNGLLLPKKLQWYDAKNNLPNKPESSADFKNIKVSKQAENVTLFKKPVDALIGEK